jgi:glycosyltransferase involved in cell wall biosynthesis
MRVAVVVPYASFVEVNMCKAFEKMGIDSWLVKSNLQRFQYRGSGVAFEEYPKTIQLPTVLDNAISEGYAPFPIMPTLQNTIQRLNVDVLSVSEHVSMPSWMFSLRKGGRKVVLTEHANTWRSTKDKAKIHHFLARTLFVPRFDGFVAIGLKAKRFLENLGARNVEVIPDPVDCELFKQNVAYDRRAKIILYAGKVDTSRRLELLLKAMKQVRREIEGAMLWIVGSAGNLSEYVRQNRQIKYLGPRPHYEMVKYYNLARVFVNPIYGEAGCGCASEEALACGTPLVGTTDLDFPFIWRDSQVGYLVHADEKSIAQGIVRAIHTGNEMHKRARPLALREFSFDAVGKRYLSVFQEAVSES